MKKTFAVLMLATMLFAVGCGNQAQEAAKDAQQKVEQKAEEVKDEASKKVEETKEASIQAAEDAVKKADEMKADIAAKAEEVTGNVNERVIALGGLMPGVSVDDVKAMFGEPTVIEENILIFADGLKVEFDDAQKVKTISTTIETFDTPEGVYVGASEYSLNDYCGPADSVHKIDSGAEYEYNSGDKKSVVVYTAQNGIITEITCSLK